MYFKNILLNAPEKKEIDEKRFKNIFNDIQLFFKWPLFLFIIFNHLCGIYTKNISQHTFRQHYK